MKNKYNSIMQKIVVTEEMHNRIMQKIHSTELSTENKKIVNFNKYKIYFYAAACLIILVIGLVTVPNFIKQDNPPIIVVPSIMEYNSAEELSENAGFDVYEPKYIPFEVTQTQYTLYSDELVQIAYSNNTNKIVFRMSFGDEDNSGDYNEYNTTISTNVDDLKIVMRGDEDNYYIVTWQNDGYAYSLNSVEGLSKADIINVIESLDK